MKIKNYTDVLISEYSNTLTEGVLKEYTDLQAWQDEIDQIQTDEDAYKIPQWVLDQLGMTRSQIMPKHHATSQTVNTKSTSPATKDYTDDKAAAKFWSYAKQNIIDYDSFHQAYDNALKAAGLSDAVWFDGYVGSVYGIHILDPNIVDLPKDKKIVEVTAKRLTNANIWFKYIKKLDSNLASVRALKKLWALQFKDNAKALKEIELENMYKQRKEDIEKFFAEVLEAIRNKLQNFSSADPLARIAYKDVITNPDSEFTLYRQTSSEPYPHMLVQWYHAINPFMGDGDSVAVKYPEYDGDINIVLANGADKLAEYFVTEFKNGNWANGKRTKLFPGEQPEQKN